VTLTGPAPDLRLLATLEGLPEEPEPEGPTMMGRLVRELMLSGQGSAGLEQFKVCHCCYWHSRAKPVLRLEQCLLCSLPDHRFCRFHVIVAPLTRLVMPASCPLRTECCDWRALHSQFPAVTCFT